MNIKEVAKLAKVSTATVSRTINGSDKVSARTAERVQKAIKELNFYPNTHARTLVSGRSRMVGFELLGMPQRDITAETSAERLRAVPDSHHIF